MALSHIRLGIRSTLSRSIMSTRRALAPNDVVIIAASRTPVGSIAGTLKSFTAPQLGIIALQHALSTIPTLSPSSIEELVFGNVVQAGVGQAPARQVVIGAGLDVACEATTVNKVCASGMKAIALAALQDVKAQAQQHQE